jgi:hypothetical protein
MELTHVGDQHLYLFGLKLVESKRVSIPRSIVSFVALWKFCSKDRVSATTILFVTLRVFILIANGVIAQVQSAVVFMYPKIYRDFNVFKVGFVELLS